MQSLDAFIALNRFGLGPAPGEADLVAADPRGWIEAQITPHQVVPPALAAFGGSDAIMAEIQTVRRQGSREEKAATMKRYRSASRDEVMERTRVMIASPAPFAERMVLFWSNHFTVSSAKFAIGPVIPAYERETIRPHVFGRFADMLKATARHPVMLTYLDNVSSKGANSKAGLKNKNTQGKAKTLNENLAREILELHTLGVNGGYGQQDVIELAKAISGWGHGAQRTKKDPRPAHGRFEFHPRFHEPGPKTILGKTYTEDGANEGLAVLDDLARHPSTARHIATKLVRHFVADEPPAGAVDRIAAVFAETDGDLAAVSRALVALPQVWESPLPKAKTHYEMIVSVHRVTGQTKARAVDVLQPLKECNQIPFTAPSPAGWGDLAEDWVAPEALMRRIEWIRRFSGGLPATIYPEPLLEDTLGPVANDLTRTWVERAPSGDAAIAMILASPEFQRR